MLQFELGWLQINTKQALQVGIKQHPKLHKTSQIFLYQYVTHVTLRVLLQHPEMPLTVGLELK